jgi:hypothetical protein
MKTQIDFNTKKELANVAIDYIKSNLPECYGCDLHNEIFNTDYYIVGYYEAELWLTKIGVFKAIAIVKEYEKDVFGEVSTDVSDSEKLANMLAYIIGEEILSESKTLNDNWNNRLSEEDCKTIIEGLEEEFN